MDRDAWNARYGAEDVVWGLEPNLFVAEHLADLPPGRALDLACGEGRNAVWLAARGWDVTGVDFSDVAVDKARRLATARGVRAEWVVADLVDWEPPGAFDLVLLAYLQVPAADRQRIWPRAAAAVAPGGTFFLVGHDVRNITEGTGGPGDPAVCYRADDVLAVLEGFTVTTAGEALRPRDGAQAVDCLVVATRPA